MKGQSNLWDQSWKYMIMTDHSQFTVSEAFPGTWERPRLIIASLLMVCLLSQKYKALLTCFSSTEVLSLQSLLVVLPILDP